MRLGLRATGLSFLLYWLADAWLTFWPTRRMKVGVVLIRLDAIGDFILWLDSAKEFRRLYSGQHIVLIANAAWADWAATFPHWDEVWPLDGRRFVRDIRYRAKMLRKVRRAGFETAIQPTYSRTFMHGDSLIRASAAIQRIGSEGDESNTTVTAKRVSNRWYTRLIPASGHQMMELERNAEFIRNLSGQPYEAALPHLPDSGARVGQRPWPDSYIVLFPGASWSGRRWPVAHFAELATRLHAEFAWPVVLCGGPGDVGLCEELGAALTMPFVDWAGRTNLVELAGVIHQSRLIVCNETSAVHIAAAVGTPAVCVVGGGHYGRFLPYPHGVPGYKPQVADHPMPCFNCNWRCSMPHVEGAAVPCVAGVSVNQVLLSAHQALEQTTKNSKQTL